MGERGGFGNKSLMSKSISLKKKKESLELNCVAKVYQNLMENGVFIEHMPTTFVGFALTCVGL